MDAKKNSKCFAWLILIFSRDIFGGFVFTNAEKITKIKVTENTKYPNNKSFSGFRKKFEFKPKNNNRDKGNIYVVNK